jgi:hypothetical protein
VAEKDKFFTNFLIMKANLKTATQQPEVGVFRAKLATFHLPLSG